MLATTPLRSGQVTRRTAVCFLGASPGMGSESPSRGRRPANGAAQHLEKLADAGFFLGGGPAVAAKEAGIELFGQERILKPLHGPVQDRKSTRLNSSHPS